LGLKSRPKPRGTKRGVENEGEDEDEDGDSDWDEDERPGKKVRFI
jgi:hypothetical protein